MYFFTADEHYGHKNIIKYCNRPFGSAHEMDDEIMRRHNEVVGQDDVVIHVGDFTLRKTLPALELRDCLEGNHIFIQGSHDYWMDCNTYRHTPLIDQFVIEGQHITVCHYAMRTWPRSHYATWHVFGHSHGRLGGMGLSCDVGVDANNFYPVLFEQLKQIMLVKAQRILDNPQGKLLDCYQRALTSFIRKASCGTQQD